MTIIYNILIAVKSLHQIWFLGMNCEYMYRVNSFMLMTKFTLNIVSGIELPAMYKVHTFNLTGSTYNY